MNCSIAWCSFTWEAFATLTAGGAAVLGATAIGIRQLGLTSQQALIAERQADVASRQADILEHQVQVERAKLRADLFERRLAVYTACKAYLRDAMSVRTDFDVTFEVAAELGRQLEQAQFLFSGNVRNRLRDAADQADNLLAERETLRDLRNKAQESQKADDETALRQQSAKVRDLNKRLRDKLGGLAEDMGEDMKLYIPQAEADSTNK